MIKEKGLITTQEAADIVGMHRNTLWNAVHKGQIPSKMFGGTIALDPKDVIAFRNRYHRGEIPTLRSKKLVVPKKKRTAAEKKAAQAEAAAAKLVAEEEAAEISRAAKQQAQDARMKKLAKKTGAV